MTDKMLLGGLGLAMALAASTPGSADAQVPGTYRLTEVAGSALPAEVEREWTCRESVTEGTLTLGADSLWSFRFNTHEVCGARTEEEIEQEGGRYTTEGDTIRFHDDDGGDRDEDRDDDADLDDLGTATLGSDGRLTARLEDGKTTLVFRR
jgi:hypothetical protein